MIPDEIMALISETVTEDQWKKLETIIKNTINYNILIRYLEIITQTMDRSFYEPIVIEFMNVDRSKIKSGNDAIDDDVKGAETSFEKLILLVSKIRELDNSKAVEFLNPVWTRNEAMEAIFSVYNDCMDRGSFEGFGTDVKSIVESFLPYF